jgi:hypothetical protein
VVDTKAREFKTKDGIVKWRLLKWIKNSHPAPPDGFLETNSKGKLMAEAIRSNDGMITWVRRDYDEVDNNNTLSGEERTVTLQQLRRAEMYKKRKISDVLWQVAPLIAILIIFTLLLVFWGDIVKPSVELAQSNAAASQQLATALDSMSNACMGRFNQVINSTRPVPN